MKVFVLQKFPAIWYYETDLKYNKLNQMMHTFKEDYSQYELDNPASLNPFLIMSGCDFM